MSLSDRLADIREGAKKRVPAELREIMKKATDELRASGILAGAVKPGDTIAPFVLPDMNKEPVSSEKLLKNGPLVLTFYRGAW